jgi:hypothetical protein
MTPMDRAAPHPKDSKVLTPVVVSLATLDKTVRPKLKVYGLKVHRLEDGLKPRSLLDNERFAVIVRRVAVVL